MPRYDEDPYFGPTRNLAMTVCIAAMAAKSKAIVMVADKAITHGTERPMQADLGIKKIIPIGKTGWHALIAGNPSFAQEVIDATVEEITTKDPKKAHQAAYPGVVKDMMRCMKESYKAVRRQWVVDRFIAPRLFDEKNPYAALPAEDVLELSSALADFKITCSLLVCGFDGQDVPHIFSVESPGTASLHDIPGFYAAGIGRDIALGELYQFETEAKESLPTAMYELFDAKATAELIQGVGYEWDCSILAANREPVEITKPVRKAMEGILREVTTSPYHSQWGSDFDKIPEWKKTIKDFADSIVPPPPPKQPTKKVSKSKPSKPRPKSAAQKSEGQP